MIESLNDLMKKDGYETAVLQDGSEVPVTLYIEKGVKLITVQYSYASDGRHAWNGSARTRYFHRTKKTDKKNNVIFVFDRLEDR